MYLADERFLAYYDSKVKGCAKSLADAVKQLQRGGSTICAGREAAACPAFAALWRKKRRSLGKGTRCAGR